MLKIAPEHEKKAAKLKEELQKRSTFLCEKFQKSMNKGSIFEAPEKRKIEVAKRRKVLEEKLKEVHKVKVQAEL